MYIKKSLQVKETNKYNSIFNLKYMLQTSLCITHTVNADLNTHVIKYQREKVAIVLVQIRQELRQVCKAHFNYTNREICNMSQLI